MRNPVRIYKYDIYKNEKKNTNFRFGNKKYKQVISFLFISVITTLQSELEQWRQRKEKKIMGTQFKNWSITQYEDK